jgi:type IV pilus assembly protein PilC
MATYQYVAKEKTGQTVTGILEAGTESEAAELLHNKSLIVISIKLSKKKVIAVRGEKKLKLDDLVVFSRQLATMIDAGIPLVQSLGILGEQIEKKDFRNIVSVVRQDIEAGMSFCDALAKHPKIFSDFFVNMARAGEASGMLDEVLDRLSTYMENVASLNRKIRASLVYPAVVMSMALIITVFLLVKVVPTFKGIFDMLGGQLPLPTQILLGISDMVKHYFFVAIGVVFLLGFLFNRYINSDKGRYNFDALKLRMFVLGPLFRKVAVAKFSRSFSTLVKSGVAILNALDIVAKTSGNKVIERAVMDCRDAVRNGEPINKTLSKSGVFPPMVCRMIGVGEQTGQLEKMLTKIADFYEDQVNAAVAGLTSMIEPLVIAFLGMVIGGIVIALFMPIFKITQLISQ